MVHCFYSTYSMNGALFLFHVQHEWCTISIPLSGPEKEVQVKTAGSKPAKVGMGPNLLTYHMLSSSIICAGDNGGRRLLKVVLLHSYVSNCNAERGHTTYPY
jgi:hypothetical protein